MWVKLPTKSWLHILYPDSDPTCPLCNQENETVSHILAHCPIAQNFWNCLCNLVSFHLQHFNLWCEGSWLNDGLLLDSDERRFLHSIILNGFWTLWKHKNGFLFERIRDSNQVLAHRTLSRTVEYFKPTSPRQSRISRTIEWHPPPSSWTKINSDGSYNPTYGAGRLCCNLVLDAEAKATWYALTKAVKRQLDNAILETDSMFLVNILTRKTEIPWKQRSIFTDCFSLLHSFCSFCISHIPREANQAADWLAHFGRYANSFTFWEDSHPLELQKFLLLDAPNCIVTHPVLA
ncbi:uncharacterized protein LOC109716250 [Ananas comosus]|uniref:Uncharacterized protein LOC109716250 n=1 Tax=Ananas comosus TaxID=4615 RepID=A0A6P5FND8_ANACO|nr:uncharacterized protein LOC109716250 [Ananas comosus]